MLLFGNIVCRILCALCIINKCDAVITINSAILVKIYSYYSLVVVARYAFNLGELACRGELPDLMDQKRYYPAIIGPSSLVRAGPWSGLVYARV